MRGIGANSLTIRIIPDSRALKVIARSVLLALGILAFPWFGGSLIEMGSSSSSSEVEKIEVFPVVFQDLMNEGILRLGDKAMFINGEVSGEILNDNEMDLISEFDIERQRDVLDDSLDFVFASSYGAAEFIDRALRVGGIVVVQLNDQAFRRPLNYKIVYVRRFDTMVIAMRKMRKISVGSMKSPAKRKLFSFISESKKEVLNSLEEVYLEPPRRSNTNSYLKRTKYLPDLIGDSFDGYPRRVFIDVGSPGRNIGWFEQNYPTRNLDFNVYNIETMSIDELEHDSIVPQIGISEWVKENVREEEYVVMKADADIVEELISSKAISFVDELFLECKHNGQRGKKNKRRRAYWECLALYGRLRDEGVAVHQWWG
ncbi:hypothetical protein GIB67_040492 [Kingdonia uniflora]|uniref:DUF7870 domain-containing protein n=1 Tax=Kingdonia uniflora TaxID=39325 RepID=A0A7J7L5E2_9MAGN|nr:hypothetical protein GIB67_040492 [Kingdonia uniflora]